MHITHFEVWAEQLRLSEPYTIAYETVVSAANVFFRLHASTGHVGHGCAAPDPVVTGETAETVLALLQDTAGPLLVGLDPTRPALLASRMDEALGWQPSALAAVEMAALDLFGQACGVPVWKLLGGARESIPTFVTIGILDAAETVEQACRWLREGFRALKLKGGLDAASDLERLRKVREAVGPDVQLAFDANQGFGLADALSFARECRGLDLAFLEQPTARDDLSALAEVHRNSPLPVMADESLTTPERALDLACGPAARLFNIKLQKVGGIARASRIEAVARAAGIGLMVGCLDESALGIAAGLHFALARPAIDYADLDSHFSLLNDPFQGAVLFRDGTLYPRDGPGLGVEP